MRSSIEGYQALVCPRCQHNGVAHCYLEWRVHPVIGRKGDTILIESDSESVDIDNDSHTTMTNVPNIEADLSHYSCDSCSFAWHDSAKRDYR